MRRFLVPEVVQTSSMDCGPAALKCLLEGFDIPVSYGRLREACQTGIDGTSIDTMETSLNQLGLRGEQLLLPTDHVFIPEAKALPALLVVTLPNGLTHFVVVWRRHRNLLQVMDPSVGRRWVGASRFMREIYRHTMPAAAADWLEFARSEDFQIVLRARLRLLGIEPATARRELTDAFAEENWRNAAAFDAALRLVQSLKEGRAVRRSSHAARLLAKFCQNPEKIPDSYWSVRPGPQSIEGSEQVLMRGAVLIRVTGKQAAAATEDLGEELAAAMAEKPPQPARELARALWRSGPSASALLLTALIVAAGGVMAEAMLFRGLFDVTQELGLVGQRLGAIGSILLFSVALLLLEFPTFLVGARLGRHIENRLRVHFLEKIPKLGDRYFQSRLTSDMAERSHATKRLRHLPDQVRQLLRVVFELCFTAAAISWLEPSLAGFVWLIVAVALLPALGAQSVMAERDLRVRSHAAGLLRFYLDAMLGLLAIRSHGGEQNVRRQHNALLGEWSKAALSLQRVAVVIESFQLIGAFGLVALALLSHSFNGSEAGRLLLLVYWLLNLPTLGQEIGTLLRQYPYYRNLTLRLLEPLGAPEEKNNDGAQADLSTAPCVEFRGVCVQVSGHRILEDIALKIESGEHVAIVGPSGAGKSSLAALLLGWLRPAVGDVLVNGAAIDVEQLRRTTAWIDPAIQLWNRSLLVNVGYGADRTKGIGEAIDAALLRDVLENLPEGMQTKLGEGGGLVSGGEGQRVRFARALLRTNATLAILDEPFRGLDRDKRRDLLARARSFWSRSTLICITHDISETVDFDRVVVVERGRVAEIGSPVELARAPESRYAQLLRAEEQVRAKLWEGEQWRRAHVRSGRIVEDMRLYAEPEKAEVA